MRTYDYLIVGAGFFGSVLAERIANDLGKTVLVIDRRPHIGGNCYSETDQETGIEFHQYGTHIFHTSSQKVWQYISQFTDFNGYHHQVLTTHKNRVFQMPINLETINTFYGLNLRPYQVEDFLRAEIAKENIGNPQNLEEKAIALIGRPLYEAFIREYTIKQWNQDPKKLPVNIINRLPIRCSYNEDYFLDARWQGIPLEGYTKLFERLLNSANIDVETNCDYFEVRNELKYDKKLIYTGPIDRFFDYELGPLEWRSIELSKEVIEVEDYQGTSVMNYADLEQPYTRIHEPRHLHLERRYSKRKTLIFYETSKQAEGIDPFYPVSSEKNKNTLEKYKSMAKQVKNVVIGGRLGDYAYYDMDKAIAAALACYEKTIAKNQ
ncbi:MAG: UDP-galactopyranose mutase [SAR324 cluster bacterium]|nr:UDP-galactopyranose mutase [SAR324 cluster bacterium]